MDVYGKHPTSEAGTAEPDDDWTLVEAPEASTPERAADQARDRMARKIDGWIAQAQEHGWFNPDERLAALVKGWMLEAYHQGAVDAIDHLRRRLDLLDATADAALRAGGETVGKAGKGVDDAPV